MAPALSLSELTNPLPWDGLAEHDGAPHLVGSLWDNFPDILTDTAAYIQQVATDVANAIADAFIGPVMPGEDPTPPPFPRESLAVVVAGLRSLVQTHTLPDPIGFARAVWAVVSYGKDPAFLASIPTDAIMDIPAALGQRDVVRVLADLQKIQAFVKSIGLMQARPELVGVQVANAASALNTLEMMEADIAAGRAAVLPVGVLVFVVRLALSIIFHVPLI